MKKNSKRKPRDFDERFDAGEVAINFSTATPTEGLSKTMKFPPMDLPMWLAAEIEQLARFQANSKASVIRQLLVEAVEARRVRVAP